MACGCEKCSACAVTEVQLTFSLKQLITVVFQVYHELKEKHGTSSFLCQVDMKGHVSST